MPQAMELVKEFKPEVKKKLLEKNRRAMEDISWIFANEEKLRTEYPDKYIAVEDKKVEFYSETIEGLVSKINSSNRKVDDFSIEYIRVKPATFIL